MSGLASAHAQPPAAGAPGQTSTGGGSNELVIERVALRVDGRVGDAIAMNRMVPGPLIRLREGEDAVLRVTNRLEETSSIHCHGLILPPDMGWRPQCERCRYPARRDLHLPLPGAPGRHQLVS